MSPNCPQLGFFICKAFGFLLDFRNSAQASGLGIDRPRRPVWPSSTLSPSPKTPSYLPVYRLARGWAIPRRTFAGCSLLRRAMRLSTIVGVINLDQMSSTR